MRPLVSIPRLGLRAVPLQPAALHALNSEPLIRSVLHSLHPQLRLGHGCPEGSRSSYRGQCPEHATSPPKPSWRRSAPLTWHKGCTASAVGCIGRRGAGLHICCAGQSCRDHCRPILTAALRGGCTPSKWPSQLRGAPLPCRLRLIPQLEAAVYLECSQPVQQQPASSLHMQQQTRKPALLLQPRLLQ